MGRKWIMNCTCNCIAFIQMMTHNLSNLCLSFFRTPSKDNIFAFSNIPVVPARCLANGMTTQCCQPWESRVRVGRPSIYMKPSTFSACFVLSEKCFANGMTTLIHASHMGNYMLHARGSETLQTFTFRLLKGNKELQWQFKRTVTFQFRYMPLLSY